MLHGSSSTPPQCPGHRSCVAAWAGGWKLVGPGGAGLTYAATQHTISCEFAAEQDRGHLLASLWANIISTLNIFKCAAGTVLRTDYCSFFAQHVFYRDPWYSFDKNPFFRWLILILNAHPHHQFCTHWSYSFEILLRLCAWSAWSSGATAKYLLKQQELRTQ